MQSLNQTETNKYPNEIKKKKKKKISGNKLQEMRIILRRMGAINQFKPFLHNDN